MGLPVVLIGLALVLSAATRRLDAYSESPYPAARPTAFRGELTNLAIWRAAAGGGLRADEILVEFSFRPGETLGQVLDGLGFAPGDAREVIAELAAHADLRRLRPLDRYAALVDRESRLRAFQLTLAERGRVTVRRGSEGWQGAWHPFVRSVEVRSVSGELEGSLESSIRSHGGEGVLAYMMADVLQWDLDFNRDLRRGDRFRMLYEAVYLDGAYRSPGDILALVYQNGGKTLEAYRFAGDGAYYAADGRPLRKMFLRSPLRYSRVTSSFSHRRLHPVLKSYRPHYGVDYGAPNGTPVRATANGVVVSAGWDGGGGKTVKVRHPNGYLTAYLHLSRFAQGIRSGRRVSQGEVIGYVGSTGLATASHLDYRIRHNGRWINPQSLKSAPADPVPREQLSDFLALRDELRRHLGYAPSTGEDVVGVEQVASVGPGERDRGGEG